jgi:ATP-dependent DNA helicase RecG
MEQMVFARNNVNLEYETAFRERTFKAYPERALRELLLNALIHRDYESNAPVRFYWFPSAIEIQNPGGLFGQVNAQNYEKMNDYRNPLIADAAKVYGYVNKFGYGIQQAKKLLLDNGNPEPQFQFEHSFVSVKIGKSGTGF